MPTGPDADPLAAERERAQHVVVRVFVIAALIAGVATTLGVGLTLHQDGVAIPRLVALTAGWMLLEGTVGGVGTLVLRRSLRRWLAHP
ncbi:MAG TPA: hypothetical protein VMW47_02665 [Verrucomicrobiae bacterium]|nr:hypothetical protein [Verrucomicrobiae bacterium]